MAFIFDSYSIKATSDVGTYPKDWTIEGSNNGVDWTVLDTQNDINFASNEVKAFNLASPACYRHVRHYCTEPGTVGYSTRIDEIRYKYGGVDVNPYMTAADAPAPNVVTTLTVSSTYAGWKAFDNNDATDYRSQTGSPQWIQFDTGVAPPIISSATPDHGAVGATVTLAGTGFGANQGTSTVHFGGDEGEEAAVTSWSDTEIVCTVPLGAATTGGIWVWVGTGADSEAFTVHSYISSLTPDEGEVDDHFVVAGSDFGAVEGDSTVTLNGVTCATTNWADDEIEAVVPAGATDGNVVVTVGGNASNGVAFDVLPNTPTISDVDPSSAYRGQEITVTGTQFGAVQGTSVITVRGVTASVVSWGATEIVCTVPVTATTGNVVVTTSAGASNGYSLTVLIPVVTEVSPNVAYEADHVTVTGTLFGSQVNGTLTVGSETITTLDIISWSATEIVFEVPSTIVSGAVKVTSYSSVSNGVALTIHGTGEIRCRFVDGISGQTRLDLNDKVYYWYLDGSDFPLPPVLNEMTSNAMSDGKRLVSSRYDDFTVTLKLLIKGDSPDDLDSRRRTLFAQLVKPNWLEFRPWGASDPVFYRTRPITSKHADWLKKFIRDWHYDTNVTVEIPVSDKVYGAERELAIANLIANPVFAGWTTGSPYDTPDDWTVTTDGTGTVEEETTDYYDPVSLTSCKLTTLDADDVAQITCDAVSVDVLLHHNPKVRAMKLDGTGSLSVDVLCYDDEDALLDTLSLVADDDPDDTEFRDVVELADAGVVEPDDFPVGTETVAIQITQEGAAGVVAIGAVVLYETEAIVGHEYQGVMGLSFGEGDFYGDRPAPMDIILSPVVKPFTDVVLGQTEDYREDFDPVQVPSGGTPVTDGTRYKQEYQEFDIEDPIVENGSFEDPEVSTVFNGDNSDEWHAFTAQRLGGANTLLVSSTDYAYLGSRSVKAGISSGTATVQERMITDLIAVDTDKVFYASFMLHVFGGGGYWIAGAGRISSTLRCYFYDVAENQLGVKVLATGYLNQMGYEWNRYGGYVFPADFPEGTTQVRLRITAYGTSCTAPQYHYWDALCWGQEAAFGETAFNLEAHTGWHLMTAGISVSDDTPGDSTLTLHSKLAHETQGDLSQLKKESECDFGDPDTDFKEVILLSDRWKKIYSPSSHVSDQADKSALEEVHRFLLDPAYDATRDIWCDHVAKVFLNSYSIVNGWQGEHMILDSRSVSPAVMTSLDGTYDTAQMYDPSFQTSPPEFMADPSGVNLTLLQVYDNDDDQELTPISDITFRYNPIYLLTGE